MTEQNKEEKNELGAQSATADVTAGNVPQGQLSHAAPIAKHRAFLADGKLVFAPLSIEVEHRIGNLSCAVILHEDAIKGQSRFSYEETLEGVKQHADALIAVIREGIGRYELALNKVASWGEGADVGPWFDEPGSARIAREALQVGSGNESAEAERAATTRMSAAQKD